MAHPIESKKKAVDLRKKGYSYKEISSSLKIAKSTASKWLSKTKLSKKAIQRLKKRKILGQYKSLLTRRRKRQEILSRFLEKGKEMIEKVKINQEATRLLCALLYWCEGNKDSNQITFTNSSPELVKTFIGLLRRSYNLDEDKFRGLLHLHEYHNEQEVRKFWSGITRIPLSQFNKSYQKPHTAKRKRANYRGCLRIRYYDARVAKELKGIHRAFAAQF